MEDHARSLTVAGGRRRRARASGDHRWARTASALVLGLAGSLFAVAPASAGHVSCGDVITTNTTLDSDVGPCPGDGLIVRADNVTLDLNGHRVFASNGPTENVGVRLGRVSGSTARNGTVEGFDAGVAIFGGSGNAVEKITARNNVNDMMEPFPFTPGTALPPEQHPLMLCDYGDGITLFNSDGNTVEQNTVVGNGPYSGISLVEDSDDNVVRKNVVEDNNVINRTTSYTGQSVTSLCGATLPGAPGMQRGRAVQDIGIRVEGPGADRNQIDANKVDNSALVGISVHSYVCNPAPGEPRTDQRPNLRNVIEHNKVTRTGAETHEIDSFADGIAMLAQGPIGRITCTSFDNTIRDNLSKDNMRHGISLGRTTSENTVAGNVVNKNAEDGIHVYAEAHDNSLTDNKGHNNARHDGADDNEGCDANRWRHNLFKVVNQACVATGGKGWVGGPGKSGSSSGETSRAMQHG